ncbi:MAG: VOC family protein [Patescibacteria group bacterium]
MTIQNIHHITAITADPQRCIAFYTGVLGFRMVKKTVNHDDPTAYHLYFGDRVGSPGTIISFFAWPDLPPGMVGTGQATAISLRVPKGSLEYWEDRFKKLEIENLGILSHLGEDHLTFEDMDGLLLRLVELDITTDPPAQYQFWADGSIPEAFAIRGIHGVRLASAEPTQTQEFLENEFSMQLQEEDANLKRFSGRPPAQEHGQNSTQAQIYFQTENHLPQGTMGAGTIHHVAWIVQPDSKSQSGNALNLEDPRNEVIAAGLRPSPVIDRTYFRSVYFHEPGGILFELATTEPGFLVNEPEDKLGTTLVLPPHLEDQRTEIESRLPPLKLL